MYQTLIEESQATTGPVSITTPASTGTSSFAFTMLSYIAASVTAGNGMLTPAGTTSHNYGTTPIYTITPESGWHIQDVKLDDSSVGAVASYSTLARFLSSSEAKYSAVVRLKARRW